MAVNGQVVTALGSKVDPATARISVEGRKVELASPRLYILLNKPAGYTCTRRDPHAKRTVLELVRGVDAYLYPAGRLDVDTEGVLILTNDGDFAQMLTHPSHELDKTYRATVVGAVSQEALGLLRRGIELEDGISAPARAVVVGTRAPTDVDVPRARRIRPPVSEPVSVVDLTIHEGRKRQVRRMFAALGHPVIRLARTAIGSLQLDDLPLGKWRRLTEEEVEGLR